MEKYLDRGVSNWISASQGIIWINSGSDFYNSATASQIFDSGLEDLNVNITPLVEEWLGNIKPNNGLIVKLTRFFRNSVLFHTIQRNFFLGLRNSFLKDLQLKHNLI